VKKAQQLEALSREREVEIQRINKDKEIEGKKKEIADIIRTRVVVDKGVAEEEERIKDVRVIAEANRLKESVRINAEAQAAEVLVKTVKAAEAAADAAKHKGREQLALAEAELESADKTARAKIRLAEGVQAEAAQRAGEGAREELNCRPRRSAPVERGSLEKMQAAALIEPGPRQGGRRGRGRHDRKKGLARRHRARLAAETAGLAARPGEVRVAERTRAPSEEGRGRGRRCGCASARGRGYPEKAAT
jgi:hypothetical protein